MIARQSEAFENGQPSTHRRVQFLQRLFHRTFRLTKGALVWAGLCPTALPHGCQDNGRQKGGPQTSTCHGSGSNWSRRIHPCCPSWVSTPYQYGVEIRI